MYGNSEISPPISPTNLTKKAPIVPRTLLFSAKALSLLTVFCLATALAAPDDAHAQTSGQRRQMVKIAEIMGGLHHLRGACYPPEREEWRISFYRMLDLQKPDEYFRKNLVGAFQESYAKHRARYPGCDHRTAKRAAKLAERGERLAQELMIEYR